MQATAKCQRSFSSKLRLADHAGDLNRAAEKSLANTVHILRTERYDLSVLKSDRLNALGRRQRLLMRLNPMFTREPLGSKATTRLITKAISDRVVPRCTDFHND